MEGRPGLGRRPGLLSSPRQPLPGPSTRLHLVAAGSKGLSDPGPTLLSNLAPCRWPAAYGGLSSSAAPSPTTVRPWPRFPGAALRPLTGSSSVSLTTCLNMACASLQFLSFSMGPCQPLWLDPETWADPGPCLTPGAQSSAWLGAPGIGVPISPRPRPDFSFCDSSWGSLGSPCPGPAQGRGCTSRSLSRISGPCLKWGPSFL